MRKRFFRPFVGRDYQNGIRGKRILVVGASFYCDKRECCYFSECTSNETKDSSRFNEECPVFKPVGKHLCNEPQYCIEDDMPKAYKNFAKAMSRYTESDDYHTTWNMMAFTNYVQYFLDGDGEHFRPTLNTDLSERDFISFNETLQELKPDIVIIWGCAFNYKVKEENPYIVDVRELEETENYVCHIRMPLVDHDITIINCYHPSSKAIWYMNLETFHKYLLGSFKEETI